MPDVSKSTSERARKRIVGKTRREAFIKRREAYFDLLVSGYSVEQIASHTKKIPSTVRRALGQALANRRLDAPEDYACPQVARLTKALRRRFAGGGRPEGDRAVRENRAELNLYRGVNVGPARVVPPAALPEIATTAPPLAYSPGVPVTTLFKDEKSCVKEQLSH